MKSRQRVFDIWAEQLNEYAGYIEREEMLPNHTPPYPSWWFDGLAKELRNLRDTSWVEKLSPVARERFMEVTA